MAKKNDLKAKEKRQKIIAAVGGVLLLGLLAFQVPRTMKMLNQSATPPPPPATAPSTVPTDPSVLPTPGAVGEGAGPTASGGGTLVDSDLQPTATSGQLVAFGRFASKDPFIEQVKEPGSSGGGSGSSSSGSGGSKPQPTSPGDGGVVGAPSTPSGSGGGGSGSSPSAAAGSAMIAVNGTEETVAVGGDFPKASPIFTLVKIVGGEARIAIAGGALASGAPTTTLKKGKTVTLVNTADGTRYELKLVSVG
ncbi:MAG TPA: hypothetical protein VFP31_02460 [Gaiellaceae bacterium]|nr:hypothetical protein [Gaiellaceae bacterium]